MKRKIAKQAASAALFLLISALLLNTVGLALRPVRTDFGAVWKPYLAEPKNSLDYLYLGSSYAYCDVNPCLVYSVSGLTGYVMAGPEQTLSIAYWYLKEALRTQTPKTVLIEASALGFQPYQNYTQINVGYMPAGFNKLRAVFSASEPDLRTGLLFELYFYHSRWKNVSLSEMAQSLLPGKTDTLKGYTSVEGTFNDISDGPFQREDPDEALYAENYAWLCKILELCVKKGIRPVVVFHPTYSRFSPTFYDRVGTDLARDWPDISYCNWSEDLEPSGLNPASDFYDPGHLNQSGATRFSVWLGDFLTSQLSLSPRAQSSDNTAAWRSAASVWTT
ncbi:MAG: hypothetical protein LKK00_04365 [Intestinimonas sp.]|nr:hypothetical protein [Intestinimonas sp.]